MGHFFDRFPTPSNLPANSQLLYDIVWPHSPSLSCGWDLIPELSFSLPSSKISDILEPWYQAPCILRLLTLTTIEGSAHLLNVESSLSPGDALNYRLSWLFIPHLPSVGTIASFLLGLPLRKPPTSLPGTWSEGFQIYSHLQSNMASISLSQFKWPSNGTLKPNVIWDFYNYCKLLKKWKMIPHFLCSSLSLLQALFIFCVTTPPNTVLMFYHLWRDSQVVIMVSRQPPSFLLDTGAIILDPDEVWGIHHSFTVPYCQGKGTALPSSPNSI